MCDTAYHQEALRKARVLERKHAALARLGMSDQRKEEYTTRKAPNNNDGSRRGLNSHDHNRSNNDVTYPSPAVRQGIENDLRKQERFLRDHNLVMGHKSAFKDYLEPNSYK